MTILFNIATRERPEQFAELLDNIQSLATGGYYGFCVKVDDDDPFKNQYREIIESRKHLDISVHYGQSYNKVHAINRDIFEGLDIIVNVSDDQRFTVKGFDNIIRYHMKDKGPVFLHFPDDYKRAACATMTIINREYWLNCAKRIYHEDYVSLWADVESTEVAKLSDCYYYIPITIFRHDHYSTTGKRMDSLYKRNNTYKRDHGIYNSRRLNNFYQEIDLLPTLLIKYPTRGRWRQFAEALDNIYSTIKTFKYTILVTADLDDPEMNSDEVKAWCKRYHNVVLEFGNHQSKIHACNSGMFQGHWDWCILMSDDMRFTEFGWDEKMWNDIRAVWPEGSDWFAHFNDGYVSHKLPTMNVCGRQWYDRFGYIYHPSYKSVSCDAENMFVAQMMGRYHYFDAVYFNHDHPANLKQPSDYIYRRNHAYGEADTQNYFARLKQYFGVENPVMVPEQMKPYL